MTNRITATFDRLQHRGEKALIPYIMAGDPSLTDTENLVLELERSGADIIELGVPFSDPIADGPIIQQAAERGLRSGTTIKRIFASVTTLRTKTHIPLVLMTYYNTIMAMGEDHFCRQAIKAGVDGIIVPDMPPEESDMLLQSAHSAGLNIIFLLAPTSTNIRRTAVIKKSRGFIYYVSLTGVTGAKLADLEDVRRNVQTLRKVASLPIAVGFGIATPEDVQQVGEFADGIIVGSAIVRRIGEHHAESNLLEQIGQFTQNLKAACNPRIQPTMSSMHI